jgi:hypothetical protein
VDNVCWWIQFVLRSFVAGDWIKNDALCNGQFHGLSKMELRNLRCLQFGIETHSELLTCRGYQLQSTIDGQKAYRTARHRLPIR